ncbi:uncharacterized protein G2W53_005089 [Senna tora]|uniref:Uncharacterized protein n=1 Tax=Senna tora TaxID=362788 RepID=A0A835CIS2_9FABA|nr:uncharacterized protein G2W53_005089 [Senna tora]
MIAMLLMFLLGFGGCGNGRKSEKSMDLDLFSSKSPQSSKDTPSLQPSSYYKLGIQLHAHMEFQIYPNHCISKMQHLSPPQPSGAYTPLQICTLHCNQVHSNLLGLFSNVSLFGYSLDAARSGPTMSEGTTNTSKYEATTDASKQGRHD